MSGIRSELKKLWESGPLARFLLLILVLFLILVSGLWRTNVATRQQLSVLQEFLNDGRANRTEFQEDLSTAAEQIYLELTEMREILCELAHDADVYTGFCSEKSPPQEDQ